MANINKRVIKDIADGKKSLMQEFGIYIAPEETDFYKIHFIMPGPIGTPFEGGLYHGMIRLNNNHPHAAPNIHMITPNGRFMAESYPIPNGSRGICTTTSSYHPESWTPVNNLDTVIKGFVSLMCDKYDGGIGGIASSDEEKKKLAKESIYHVKNEPIVFDLFPELFCEDNFQINTQQKEIIKKVEDVQKILDKKVENVVEKDNELNKKKLEKDSNKKPKENLEKVSIKKPKKKIIKDSKKKLTKKSKAKNI